MSLQRIEPYRRSSRCLECNYPREKHLDGLCPLPHLHNQRFATMNLPEVMTCADCKHLKHPCATIYGRIGTDEVCDWFPSRFSPKDDRPKERVA